MAWPRRRHLAALACGMAWDGNILSNYASRTPGTGLPLYVLLLFMSSTLVVCWFLFLCGLLCLKVCLNYFKHGLLFNLA